MKLSVLGTSGDHLGPSGTIWGPSFEEVIDFSHFHTKYVIFSQKHTFQILDAHFPKRFRLKPHINQKNLKKVFQKWQFPRDFIEFVGKTTPDSEKKCCHGPN